MKRLNAIIINIYNFLISRTIINKNNVFCRRIRQVLFHNICHECHASFGNQNGDRLFYVIRCPKDDLGFFGLYNYVVDYMKKAISMNAEPVVDWKYYPNNYISEDNLVGKENVWEYFFENPTGISIDEVYRSKNVIMGGCEWITSLGEVHSYDNIKGSHEIIKKYVRLNEETKEYVKREYERLNMASYRVLGVKCRGTDFVETKPKFHTIPPNVNQIVEKIQEVQDEWGGYEKVFVATEDENMFKELYKHYQEKMMFCETSTRIGSANGQWLNRVFDGETMIGKKRQAMQEYLREIYLLARCDALIAPVIGGTLGAVRIKGGFENQYFFKLGQYE